jgi:hypothetical protein
VVLAFERKTLEAVVVRRPYMEHMASLVSGERPH